MPRKRMLYPGYFTSATLASLELRTMITFAGLWIYVDDFGRGEDDPAFIAANIWARRPSITAEHVAEDLAALADHDVLCRYKIGAHPLLHIPSWFEHQKVSHPTPSKLPPCPTCDRLLWTDWYRDDDTATDRYRRAAKAHQRAKTGSGGARDRIASVSRIAPEKLGRSSRLTLPSLVQLRVVQLRRADARLWTAA